MTKQIIMGEVWWILIKNFGPNMVINYTSLKNGGVDLVMVKKTVNK